VDLVAAAGARCCPCLTRLPAPAARARRYLRQAAADGDAWAAKEYAAMLRRQERTREAYKSSFKEQENESLASGRRRRLPCPALPCADLTCRGAACLGRRRRRRCTTAQRLVSTACL
jgi:hypothetical protein